jgi:hypothetical protein
MLEISFKESAMQLRWAVHRREKADGEKKMRIKDMHCKSMAS